MKEKIKKWYTQGLWSIDMVKNAVKKNVITTEDYIDITE
jgi:hypothetical protein